MTSPPRLRDLPFLTATLAMALSLALPWAFAGPPVEPQPGAALFWTGPEAFARDVRPEQPVRLASEAAAPGSAAQP